MSIEDFFVRSVVIVAPVITEDRRGDDEKNWDAATRTTIEGGWLGPIQTTEDHDHREATIGTAPLRLPLGTVITGIDRVEVDDVTYEVDGDPYTPWTPRGGHHTVARVRRVAG